MVFIFFSRGSGRLRWLSKIVEKVFGARLAAAKVPVLYVHVPVQNYYGKQKAKMVQTLMFASGVKTARKKPLRPIPSGNGLGSAFYFLKQIKNGGAE